MSIQKKMQYVSVAVLAAFGMASPAAAEEHDQALEQAARSMQSLGQAIIEHKTAPLQEAILAEITGRYEDQLAQRSSDHMDRVALAVEIDSELVVIANPEEMLSSAAAVEMDLDCDYSVLAGK